MVLFNKPTDWANAKKVMGEANFLQQIKGFDKDHISVGTILKVKKYIDNPVFKKDAVAKVSVAAAAL
jgi:dynein heavy chain